MSLKAAVIGHPIGHSLSPAIFQFLAQRFGEARLTYAALDIRPENLNSCLQSLRKEENWLGVNVTIPHKEKILQLADQITDGARAVGAANVLHVQEKQLIAYNTDIFGIQAALDVERISIKKRNVLILGAGGAARAAAFACGSADAQSITVCNRSYSKAESLIQNFQNLFPNIKWQALDAVQNFHFSEEDLIIQSTPLGMKGYGDVKEAEDNFRELFKFVQPRSVAFDLVYRPEKTFFLQEAEIKNLKTVSGLLMLIGQALATWEIWFDRIPDKDKVFEDLAQFLRRHLETKP